MSHPLTHRIDGDGPPLILLNGGLMTIPSWEPLMPSLSSESTIVRCDFRGQLLSPGDSHPSLDGHVADLVALLDRLGITEIDVFGTSFGGEVGLMLAAQHPHRVRSLFVLTSTDRLTDQMHHQSRQLVELAVAAAEGGDGGAVFRALAPNTFSQRWLEQQSPDFVEQRAAQIAQLPPKFFLGLAGLMSALETLDLSDALFRITSPTLVAGAELDAVFPVEHSRALAAAIQGAGLEIIEGSGHAAIVEATGRVLSLLHQFLGDARMKANA